MQPPAWRSVATPKPGLGHRWRPAAGGVPSTGLSSQVIEHYCYNYHDNHLFTIYVPGTICLTYIYITFNYRTILPIISLWLLFSVNPTIFNDIDLDGPSDHLVHHWGETPWPVSKPHPRSAAWWAMTLGLQMATEQNEETRFPFRQRWHVRLAKNRLH